MYNYFELILNFLIIMLVIYLIYRYLLFNNKIDKIILLKKKEKDVKKNSDNIDKDWRL